MNHGTLFMNALYISDIITFFSVEKDKASAEEQSNSSGPPRYE